MKISVNLMNFIVDNEFEKALPHELSFIDYYFLTQGTSARFCIRDLQLLCSHYA